MKHLLLLFTLLFSSIIGFSTVYTTIADGNWNNNSTWDGNSKPGTYFGAGDQVIINHNINFNQNVGFAGTLTINSSGSLIGLSNNLRLDNGASIVANGITGFNNLTLNSISSGLFSESLTVNNDLTIGNNSNFITNETLVVDNNFNNNGGTVTTNETVTIGNNLFNNNGQMTFNESTTVGGIFNNNNGNSEVTINDNFSVSGDFQNNSGATLTITSDAQLTVDGNMANNFSSELNNAGIINSGGNFNNNGGTVQNDGAHFVDGNFTQNGGTYTNDGVLIAGNDFRVNGGGTVDGNGIIRADNVTNFGTITGTNDICGLDDSTPSNTNGNSFGASTTNCEESASVALPIELAYFKVKLEEKSLKFEWLTYSEINNHYFEVEYSSDGIHFSTLIKELGAGNSSSPILYIKEINSTTLNTKGYYRLKQTDYDGNFSYSKHEYISQNINQSVFINLFPNPTNGNELFLSLNNEKTSRLLIKIHSSEGKLVYRNEFSKFQNDFDKIEVLQGYKLNIGIYYLIIETDSITEKLKFIVE